MSPQAEANTGEEAEKPTQRKKTIARAIGLGLLLLAIAAVAYGTGLTDYFSIANLDTLRAGSTASGRSLPSFSLPYTSSQSWRSCPLRP